MRSGSTVWRAPLSRATPSTTMRDGAGAADLRAHLVEAVGDVADLRLARGVLDHRGAAGERGRHQRRVGAADGDLGEFDRRRRASPFCARAIT